MATRRGFLAGLFAAPFAPALARIGWLAPVAPVVPVVTAMPIGCREDLADIIYKISPEETPFLSAIRRAPSSRFHEWQTDALIDA